MTKLSDAFILTQAIEALGRITLLEWHKIRRRFGVGLNDVLPTTTDGGERELFYWLVLAQLDYEATGRRDYDQYENLTQAACSERIVAVLTARFPNGDQVLDDDADKS